MTEYQFIGLIFSAPLTPTQGALEGSYNLFLVLVSIAIAATASFAAINVSYSISRSVADRTRRYWMVAGAVSLGSGIWAMHFIGMVSFDMGMSIQYDPILTAISVMPAIFAGGIALYITSKPELTRLELLGAGVITGAGIGTMHYAGMDAMIMDARMVYEPVMFSASIVVAVVLSCIALSIPRRLTSGDEIASLKGRFVGAAFMGAAISSMHYMGMAALSIVPLGGDDQAMHMDTMLLASAAVIIAVILVAISIFATMVDHILRRQREHNDKFESMVGLSADLILIVRNGEIDFANAKAHEVLASKNLIGRHLADFISFDYALLFDAEDSALSDMSDTGDTLPMVLFSTARRSVDVELGVRRITHKGDAAYFLEFKDVTSIKENARKTLEREESLSAIMDGAADGIITMNTDGMIISHNQSASQMFKCSSGHLEGGNLVHFLGGNLASIEAGTREVLAMRTDGSEFPAELSVNAMRTDQGQKLVAIMRDITTRKEADAKIKHLASTDLITGLPNRLELIREIEGVAGSDDVQREGAVMYVSLSGHQRVSDAHGHLVTEKLLRAAGERLSEEFRGEYTVGSWGSSEFLLVLKGTSKLSRIERMAATIHDLMEEPFTINGNEIKIGCDIGVSRFHIDATDATHLIRGAGLAMFRGRLDGAWPYRLYSEDIDRELAEAHQLESDLAQALANNELRVFYQPKMDLANGGIQGMEALVRWIHPQHGMISPVQFIPVAEKTGLIIPIGAWILRQACKDTRAWVEQGHDLKVAVNLSGRQFEDNSLLDLIKEVLEENELDARHLELEVTESALMDDIDAGMQILNEVRAMGITVAIDDFGTGYSSLSYLKKLPLDTLKVDQSFVRDATTDADDAAIVTTIVGMANCLNLKVVAEGIETEEHATFLRDLKCQIGQGYLFSKPLPADQFSAFLEDCADSRRARPKAVVGIE